jgi:phage terminase small subunit
MGLPKKLTEQQKKFALELVTNEGRKTKSECAVEAGYAKDRASITASELTNPKKYPLVVQYIGELRAEFQKKYEITYENHISELAKIRNKALDNGAWSAAVNAEVNRGKAAGLYIEQKIIRTGKLDDLSEEDLDRRISEVLDQYSPILEDVKSDELKAEVKSRQEKIRLNPKQRNKLTTEVIDVSDETESGNYSSSSSSESESSSQSSESSEE